MTGIAHRNVHLVRRDDAELRISKLPPVLMADYDDVDCARGFWRILNRVDYPRGGEIQDYDDKYRKDRPGQFNLCAPVYLGRFPAVAGRLASEFDDCV